MNFKHDIIRRHYEMEKNYASRILSSEKNSEERSRLIKEGYEQIIKIIEQYNPGGGGTDHTDVVFSIINKLIPPGGQVFDLGCGSGKLIVKLINEGYKARGIDVSSECIRLAKQNLSELTTECDVIVSHNDIASYDSDTLFDLIVLDNVIEHMVPDMVSDVLSKCYNMLRNKGNIVILTPHRYSGPHDISMHFLPLGTKAEGFHLKEYSFTDIDEELRKVGFTKILGFPFHPRLFAMLNYVPISSQWAANKSRYFEELFTKRGLSNFLKVNTSLTRLIVALFFPSVCVGIKEL